MDKQAFLARKPKAKSVTLDDGAKIQIRKLSQGDVERMGREYAADEKKLQALRFVVSRCVIDENGARLFDENDLDALADLPFDDLNTIAVAALKFSGMQGVEATDAKNA